MALISTDEALTYLRVDSSDETGLIEALLKSAEKLCVDVGRLTMDQWAAINGDSSDDTEDIYSEEELKMIRPLMKAAIYYTLGYLYEHREEADHHELVLTLRNLLFSLREGVV